MFSKVQKVHAELDVLAISIDKMVLISLKRQVIDAAAEALKSVCDRCRQHDDVSRMLVISLDKCQSDVASSKGRKSFSNGAEVKPRTGDAQAWRLCKLRICRDERASICGGGEFQRLPPHERMQAPGQAFSGHLAEQRERHIFSSPIVHPDAPARAHADVQHAKMPGSAAGELKQQRVVKVLTSSALEGELGPEGGLSKQNSPSPGDQGTADALDERQPKNDVEEYVLREIIEGADMHGRRSLRALNLLGAGK